MRILHVINNLSSGGAEKLIEQALPIMNKFNDIELEVLLLTDEKNVFDKGLKEEGITISIVPLRKVYNIRNIFYVRKFIINGKYDIVHVHLFPAQYWVALASELIFNNKPKFITTEHNTFNRRREKKYLKFIEKVIYSSYDKIISISEKTDESLKIWLNPNRNETKKFVIIENGIDTDRFSKANLYKKQEIHTEFNDHTKLICMIGRFSEQKDQATLIKAVPQLPENVHLLLVGEGPLKEKDQDLAKQLEIDNRVHFLGFRNDVERILKTSDIIVLSSNWEGFGLAAVEGMAAKKPVIGTNVDGLSDVIGDKDMLFQKGNVNQLAICINRLINNVGFYEQKAENSMRLCKKYDISNMVKKYIKIYKSFIK